MADSIFTSTAPYHIIAYGTLLGTEFFQTWIGGIVSYRALPRAQFSSLQQALFPVYFSIQSALPVVLALTYPGERSPLGAGAVSPSGLSGFMAEKNRMNVLLPIVTIFATSILNLAYVGPATTKIMKDRKHQETRDGKKSYDPAPHSKEMMKLNKAFGRMHGVSSLLNMVGFCTTVFYGFFTLGGRLQ